MKKILPVLFGFFVMGFCDVVGITQNYAKESLEISKTVAGFISTALFMWFLILSVPTALLMGKIGRKTTVQISNIITFCAMLIPLFVYNFTSIMITFALLGIGNTMLQVSLNPLLTNVVKGDSLTSSLTAGQVVKAISSYMGPIIAAFAAANLGGWHMIFPIYAGLTLLSAAWLMLTQIEEEPAIQAPSVGQTFSLLSDKNILFCVLGIVAVVGLDVGTNTFASQLLSERFGWDETAAGEGPKFYFLCRTAGAFIGAFLLSKMKDKMYLCINMVAAAVSLVALAIFKSEVMTFAFIGAVGFFASSIFAVLFSLAIQARPDKGNEISGLMISGVVGGAITPPLMGVADKYIAPEIGSIVVLGVCVLYLLSCSFIIKTKEE